MKRQISLQVEAPHFMARYGELWYCKATAYYPNGEVLWIHTSTSENPLEAEKLVISSFEKFLETEYVKLNPIFSLEKDGYKKINFGDVKKSS